MDTSLLTSLDQYNDKFIHKCKMEFVSRDLYKKFYKNKHVDMLEELENTVPKTAYHMSVNIPFDPGNLVIVLVDKGTPSPHSWDATFTVSYFNSIEKHELAEIVRQKGITGEQLMNLEKKDWKGLGLTLGQYLQLKHYRPSSTLTNDVYISLQEKIQRIWDKYCKKLPVEK